MFDEPYHFKSMLCKELCQFTSIGTIWNEEMSVETQNLKSMLCK